jgi:hypothetical protein
VPGVAIDPPIRTNSSDSLAIVSAGKLTFLPHVWLINLTAHKEMLTVVTVSLLCMAKVFYGAQHRCVVQSAHSLASDEQLHPIMHSDYMKQNRNSSTGAYLAR